MNRFDVKVYETKRNIYIIMEWLQHGDLFKAIVKARRCVFMRKCWCMFLDRTRERLKGAMMTTENFVRICSLRFPEDVARHVIQQLCSAIRYCHLRGIVHKVTCHSSMNRRDCYASMLMIVVTLTC